MKKLYTLILLSAGSLLSAQTLTNPDFENWSVASTYSADTLPNQWWSMYCNTTHQSTDSYQGAYSTRIQGYMGCGIAQGIMVNGQKPASYYGGIIESGTPFTSKPASISGFYKYTNVQAGDSAEVTIILKKYNAATGMRDTVALGSTVLPATVAYSLFTVNLSDILTSVTPDSIIIAFNSSKYNMFDMTTYTLPNLYIDRIILPETPSGIVESSESVVSSVVYPNPFSETATLALSNDISNYKDVSVLIFDARGKEVMSVNSITGNNVKLNKGALGNAAYFYVVKSSGMLIGKGKFLIQ